MDYKELIRRLDDCGEFDGDLLDAAATAIETLLAERDAAIEELRGQCGKCKHFEVSVSDFPCCHCSIMGGMSDYWQWRGPQEERGDE